MKRYMMFVASMMMFIVGVSILTFIYFSKNLRDFGSYGQAINTAMFAFLELLGIAVGIWLLHLYFRRRAQHKFIFEGFSNEAEFLTAEQKTLNLSKLALEELISQFHLLYNQLHLYAQRGSGSLGDVCHDQDTDSPEEQSPVGHSSQKSQNHQRLHRRQKLAELRGLLLPTSDISSESTSVSSDIWDYLFSPEEAQEQIEVLEETLSEMVDDIGTTTSPDLASMMTDVVPKSIASVMKFFDMLISPSVVKGIGYLQYQGDQVGITIDIVDLRKQKSLLLHTFWRKITSSGQEQTGTKDMRSLIPLYIELFGPAMRWLALQVWAQKVGQNFSGRPFSVRHLFHWPPFTLTSHEKEQRANTSYLLGALYCSSAEQPEFDPYKRFFLQEATSYLQRAADEKKNWWCPYMYLAKIYYQLSREENQERIQKALLRQAVEYYDTAYNNISPKDKEERTEMAKHTITIERAISVTDLLDDKLINDVREYIKEKLEKEIKPETFYPKYKDASILLLYNVAVLYIRTYDEYLHIRDAVKKALQYLIYSLARAKFYRPDSNYLWDRLERDSRLKYMLEGFEKKAIYHFKILLLEKIHEHHNKDIEATIKNIMEETIKEYEESKKKFFPS